MRLNRSSLRRIIEGIILEQNNVSITGDHPALKELESAFKAEGLKEGEDYVNLIENPNNQVNAVVSGLGSEEKLDEFLSKCYFAITEEGMQQALPGGSDSVNPSYGDDNATVATFDDFFLNKYSSKLPMKVIKDPTAVYLIGDIFDIPSSRYTDYYLIVHATAPEPKTMKLASM